MIFSGTVGDVDRRAAWGRMHLLRTGKRSSWAKMHLLRTGKRGDGWGEEGDEQQVEGQPQQDLMDIDDIYELVKRYKVRLSIYISLLQIMFNVENLSFKVAQI